MVRARSVSSAVPRSPAMRQAPAEVSMFHSIETLLEIPLATADGETRAIRNFLFDDRSWLVRFLVVDVGKWLAPRQVVIPASAVDVPDWKGHIIRAHLTSAELLASPDAETIRPVSRQQQTAWAGHFGWGQGDPNWSGPSSADFPRREFNVGGEGNDPHLRRTGDLISYQVWAKNGYLGLLEGFFLEDASWHIGYLLTRTGDWVCEEKVVPSSSVAAISWGQRRVMLDCPSDSAHQQASF